MLRLPPDRRHRDDPAHLPARRQDDRQRSRVRRSDLVTLSPFMIYYSTEARGYAVMIALLLASTLCLLRALEAPGVRWWVAYGAFSCAAMYTHYTVAFALIAQALWALWFHPPARRAVLAANLGAALAYLPWASGAIADLNSPTTKIASILLPFNADSVGSGLLHWSVGYPWGLSVRVIPGYPAIALICAGLLLAPLARVADLRGARPRPSLPAGLALVLVLAIATPLGEALSSAVSTNLFGTRNLAASWPALALCAGALVTSPRSAVARTACTLLVIGGLGIAGAKMLGDSGERPAYGAAARTIEERASGSDVIVESSITPGPLTSLDTELSPGHQVIRLGIPQESDHPFSPFDRAATPGQVAAFARAAAGPAGRIYVLGSLQGPYRSELRELLGRLRPAFAVSEVRDYPGFDPVRMWILSRAGASRAGASPRE
ncbi:MAG: glycosyltransferase family 39 protein [Solirubrobacterales bacterium]